jgi:hypothetical protein
MDRLCRPNVSMRHSRWIPSEYQLREQAIKFGMMREVGLVEAQASSVINIARASRKMNQTERRSSQS